MKIRAIMTGMVLGLAACFSSYSETSTAPLPSLDTVIERAIEKAQTSDENDRTFRRRYAYTRASVKEFRNGDGDLKKQEKNQGINDPDRKRIRKVSAAPAPAPVQLKSGMTAVSSRAPTETQSNIRGKAFEKKDFLMNRDLLDRFDFTIRGRETINGRDALVIDFQPKPGELPENTLKDRFINKGAGRVWLDEEDAQLVRADLHLTKRVDVLGGLVGSVFKFNCTISRERTEEGLWFTRSTGWHVEGREVFFRRIVDFHEDTTDVHRVH